MTDLMWPQAIVFDMDGVIIDSHPVHRKAWRMFLQTLDKEVSDRDLDCILEGWKREDILRHFLGNLTPQQLIEYGNRKDQFFQQIGVPIEPVKGLCEFLDHLTQLEIPKAVATSASERRTHFTLEQLRLTHHFAAVVTANDVPNGKPDPAIYLLAAKRLRIAPTRIAVIEDSVSGVKAAKAAGMKCLAIADNSRRALLRGVGADNVVHDFTNLTLDRMIQLLNSPRAARRSQYFALAPTESDVPV